MLKFLLYGALAVPALLVLAYLWGGRSRGPELRAGMAAPDFALPDQAGTLRRLADYRGHWVVLYFYPKDDTPGCTTEACVFRDDYLQLRSLGAQVLGVSVDDRASHVAFADKYHLPFPLLADTQGEVAARYGCLWALGPLRLARRQTFLVDPHGRLARIYRTVSPADHGGRVLADLRALIAAGGQPSRGSGT